MVVQKTYETRLARALAIAASLCLLPSAASAVPIITAYEFTGNCIDCAKAANVDTFEIFATLELQDYSLGTRLNTDNFYSFTYWGSNLVEGFTITEVLWDSAVRQVLERLAIARA